ncbi:Ser-Thr-rich glycosyl-phosphatidyl-inositol-anchored membrane family-domain-containing protein [Absidia repens]|uniref:Ser-Thr-rich glycosyl-phosphatidyl-inositol-anchored membrane family-domain-containing protein n=1 Tax=Absidia repens TaxID=90262 RepID=A0A1X2HYD8_9FUNG|nr:Ser-Thr-rich glycosyl-phosphatidyl-inositol-anchored membrane family-domain-containing protein [Absidia repens]
MKLSAVVVAALVSMVSAQSSGAIISVTAPLQGASYKAGDKAIISWINPSVESISQIVLAKGGSTSLQPVTTIATNVPASSGSYTWNIPADIPAGSDYAFEFGTSPNLAFTGQFSITGGGGGGGASSSSNSSAGAGAPKSSAAASGSSLPSGASSKPSSSISGSAASAGSAGSAGSGSAGSASGSASSGSSSQSSSSSAANSLTASSVAVVGAALIAIAQVF